MKAAEVEGSKVKRKGIMEKKIEFSSEGLGFLFKPINLFIRSQISETVKTGNKQQREDKEKEATMEEIIVISPTETKVTKEKEVQSKRKIRKESEADFPKGHLKDKEEIVK